MVSRHSLTLALGLLVAGCTSLFEDSDRIYAASFDGVPATAVVGPDTVRINTPATFRVTSYPCGPARAADLLESSVGEIVVRARTRGQGCSPSLALFMAHHIVEAQWKIPAIYEVRFVGECAGVECVRKKFVVVIE